MTTYSSIASGEIDAESPLTDALFGKLRNNPLAMFEGAAGAPRLLGEAIATGDNGGLPILSVTASDAYDLLDFGGVRQFGGTLDTTSSTGVVAHTVQVQSFSGSIRMRASHAVSPGSYISTLALQNNGVTVASWNTTSSTPQARSIDVPCSPGDVLTWVHLAGVSGDHSIVSGIAVRASNTFLPTSAWRRAF